MKRAEVKAEKPCAVGSGVDGAVEFHGRGMIMAAIGTFSQHRVQHRTEDKEEDKSPGKRARLESQRKIEGKRQ